MPMSVRGRGLAGVARPWRSSIRRRASRTISQRLQRNPHVDRAGSDHAGVGRRHFGLASLPVTAPIFSIAAIFGSGDQALEVYARLEPAVPRPVRDSVELAECSVSGVDAISRRSLGGRRTTITWPRPAPTGAPICASSSRRREQLINWGPSCRRAPVRRRPPVLGSLTSAFRLRLRNASKAGFSRRFL